jgi:hypothetical protein
MLPQQLVFTGKAVPATNNYHKWVALNGLTVVGMTLCAASFGGAPTGFSVDLNDDGAAAITALAANTAGTAGEWRSTATGGSNDVVQVARGSVLSVDLNFTGGSTPNADYTLVIHYLPSAD